MEKLTKEEVLHVAELGRLELNEEEIEKFSYQLKALLNEINKINEIKIDTEETLITPSENKCLPEKDEPTICNYTKKLTENAPKKFDNFIEIRGVFKWIII